MVTYRVSSDDSDVDRTVRLSSIADHPPPEPPTSIAFAGIGRYCASRVTSLTQVSARSDSISPTSPEGVTSPKPSSRGADGPPSMCHPSSSNRVFVARRRYGALFCSVRTRSTSSVDADRRSLPRSIDTSTDDPRARIPESAEGITGTRGATATATTATMTAVTRVIAPAPVRSRSDWRFEDPPSAMSARRARTKGIANTR